jgi:hypothetical protein
MKDEMNARAAAAPKRVTQKSLNTLVEEKPRVQSHERSAFVRRDFDTALIVKALTDAKFRESLLRSPKAIYESELGRTIPKEVKIHVLEESGDTLYLVIPHSPHRVSREAAEALAAGQRTHREPCWGLGDPIE